MYCFENNNKSTCCLVKKCAKFRIQDSEFVKLCDELLMYIKTYLVKDPLGFFKLLESFDVSFSWSSLVSAIFLFLIDVSFQGDETKLRDYEPKFTVKPILFC